MNSQFTLHDATSILLAEIPRTLLHPAQRNPSGGSSGKNSAQVRLGFRAAALLREVPAQRPADLRIVRPDRERGLEVPLSAFEIAGGIRDGDGNFDQRDRARIELDRLVGCGNRLAMPRVARE